MIIKTWLIFLRLLGEDRPCRLYRLALQLQQHGVTSLRFGAVNCATEHQLCTEQGWLGSLDALSLFVLQVVQVTQVLDRFG